MDKGPENELGKVHIHVPEGAKINGDSKNLPPPETQYEERRETIQKHIAKTLCGGKYGQSNK